MKTLTVNGREREVLEPEEAINRGYFAFTYGYHPRSEAWMLDGVARDMDRGGADWVIVYGRDPHGKDETDYVELWKRSYKNARSLI